MTRMQTQLHNQANNSESPTAAESSAQAAASRGETNALPNAAGVILAGVHQWGGCSLDRALPRPLLPVVNRPLITHSMGWLTESGVESLHLCANSHTRLLKTFLGGDTWNLADIEYYEDDMPRGPAGCVLDACRQTDKELLIVVDGTIIPQVDMHDALRSHRESGAVLTVIVTNSPSLNTRPGLLAPAGVYIMQRSTLEHISEQGYQDIKEKLIPDLYERGERVGTYQTHNSVARVTGGETYLAVNGWMTEWLAVHDRMPIDYRRIGDAWVHSSCAIDDSAELIGPMLVGPGTTIEAGVTVVGPTTLGAYNHIERNAVICRSAVWDGCRVGSRSVIDRCVLATGVHVPQKAVRRNAIFTGKQRNLPLMREGWW